MKFKISNFRFHIFLIIFLGSMIHFGLPSASEKWSGVDETVVERFARSQGREAREPLINTGHGDLPLFLFLIAGAVGGFAAGYYWRKLIAEKTCSRRL